MKTICIIAFLMLPNLLSHKTGSGNVLKTGPPNGLVAGGIVITCVGTIAAGAGLLLCEATGDTGGKGSNTSGPPPPQDNTGLYVAAAGGALIAGGIVMICAGASRARNGRFSLVAPRANQLGIAYQLYK